MGDAETVRREVIEFQDKYEVDEIIALSNIYDSKKEIQSYNIFKQVSDSLNNKIK